MRINLGSVEVTERERRALSIRQGGTAETMATRGEVREFIRDHGSQELDRLAFSPEYSARLNAARDRAGGVG